MARWFRFYDEVVHDPKVQRLPGDKFKAWVNLLCLASKHDGNLPPLADMAFALRLAEAKVMPLIGEFCQCGLLDVDESGARATYSPHNWKNRQYQSDASKDRVQRHRNKRAAAGLIPQWTAPAGLRTSVYEADNFECVYCGSKEFLSLDHKTSELTGGTHDFDNLVTACRSCNGAKRDLTFDEYVTRHSLVTLHGRYRNAPRVQITEQISERKKDGAKAPIVDLFPKPDAPPSEEKSYYDRSKEILGPKGNGLAAKLLRSQKKIIAKARAIVETSSTKSDPAAYIGAVIRGASSQDEMGEGGQPGYGDDWA